MKKYILLFLVASFLMIGHGYCVEKKVHHDGAPRRDRMEEFFEGQNLTDKEKADLSVYRDSHRKKMELFREQLKSCREQLRVELEKNEPDRNNIHKIAAQMKQVQAAMLDARIDAILTMKAKLKDIRPKKSSSPH